MFLTILFALLFYIILFFPSLEMEFIFLISIFFLLTANAFALPASLFLLYARFFSLLFALFFSPTILSLSSFLASLHFFSLDLLYSLSLIHLFHPPIIYLIPSILFSFLISYCFCLCLQCCLLYLYFPPILISQKCNRYRQEDCLPCISFDSNLGEISLTSALF